ncbi:7707_t:CDS:1, partial [Ambispora leptoticha]
DCCCDDYPIIRDDPSKVKRGGVEMPCCEPKPKQCCDCILDYCNFIPTRCDKHQRILGQIQFQQFKNCSIKATGYLIKAKACCENCDEVVSPPNLDFHVVDPTNYNNVQLDLDSIVTLGKTFSNWVFPVGRTLNGFNQFTCLVAIDTSSNENKDYILGTAPVIM